MEDGIMNTYFTMAVPRFLTDDDINSGLTALVKNTTCALHSTFFWTQLERTGFPGIQKWHRKRVGSKRSIIIPINDNDCHWVVYIIELDARRILYYNSLEYDRDTVTPQCQRLLTQYIDQAYGQLQWQLILVRKPQQTNFHDCGIMIYAFVRKYLYKIPMEDPEKDRAELSQIKQNKTLIWKATKPEHQSKQE
jgi:Ulp1 family protease